MNIILYTLITTHFSIFCMCIYIHRGISHNTLKFHPAFEAFIKLWLWLTESAIVKYWATTHRDHHRYADTRLDHHPLAEDGVAKMACKHFYLHLFSKFQKQEGVREAEFVGFKENWVEKNIYNKHYLLGLFLMLLIDVLLFSWSGVVVWILQMIWTPFWVSMIVNGFGHCWGYRNYNTNDKSTNIFPIGILVMGAEMHNNHHGDPRNPKNSRKWFEFDLGWVYIKIFEKLGLLTINAKEVK